jgi:Spy/CpxP family protein refolding chaperone
MGNWKFKTVVAGSSVLVLALAIAAGAAQQGNPARAGSRVGIAQNLEIQEFVRGLRLTEAQREAIRDILQSHRTEIRNTREALLRARLALVREEPKGPADFSAAQAGAMELRLRVFAEIKTKLTADQLARLQERQERRAERLERMLERLQERVKN